MMKNFIGHTWDPSCTFSNLEITAVVFDEALRMYGSLSVAQFFLQLFLAHQKKAKELAREKKEKELLDSELKAKLSNNNDSTASDLNKVDEVDQSTDNEKQQLIKNNLKENVNDVKNLDKQLSKLDKPSPSSSQLSDYELVRKIFLSSVKSWIRSSVSINNFFSQFRANFDC